ncbi:MAG: RecX family transcriptional regulator [Muribaculaceae bacterium]|nr:RecX family transcriptional regulator [Muribaculaceae bacterium]
MTPKRKITIEGATLKAESLCARAEYSAAEIMKRLLVWGISRGDAEKIVDSLIDQGFIDDQRFAMAYVRQQAIYARWGQRKIIMAMYTKGIDRSTINEALESITTEQWIEGATSLACAKARTMGEIDYNAKVKIYRHLASRGYDASTINAALKNLTRKDDELD